MIEKRCVVPLERLMTAVKLCPFKPIMYFHQHALLGQNTVEKKYEHITWYCTGTGTKYCVLPSYGLC
jgi:hypothetical protein